MTTSRFRRFRTLAALACAFAAPAWSQEYAISTYAGGAWPLLPAEGPSISVGYPRAVAPDGRGGVYFTSTGLNGAFKLDAAGSLTVVAGNGKPSSWFQNSPANGAYIGSPQGLAVDAAGNLYLADTDTNQIRKVDANGTLSTVAGGGHLDPGDGQQATLAQLFSPADVALDAAGNLYIAETRGRVRKVDTHGIITTVAGTGALVGSAINGKPAAQAHFSRPTGLAVDGAGNLYVADAALYYVYRIDPKGVITVAAGNGTLVFTPDGGPAASAGICPQGSLGADAAGNLYIPDTLTNSIRKVDAQGILTTVAGSPGSFGFGGDGGPATSAVLSSPQDAAPDAGGVLWIADSSNFRVRKVDAAGVIATAAGLSGWAYAGDGGVATSAMLSAVSGVALDPAGNLFIADTNNARIRQVSTAHIMTTVAGNGIIGNSGDGGPAASARLFTPSSVAVDSAGNVYFGDLGRVRKVDATGAIDTELTTTPGRTPAVAVDPSGNLYVADGDLVRKIDSYGTATTVAGTGTAGYSGDGGEATQAQLSNPTGTALDSDGNLYIADLGNARIRMVDPAGNIHTAAGNGTYGYSGDGGEATSAQLWDPAGVAVDSEGALVIADGSYVRRVDRMGIITTIASGLSGAVGIAAGAGIRLYVAESNNDVVRVLVPPIPDLVVAVTHSGRFAPRETGAVYAITVGNAGASPTSGTVTVSDTLPATFTATAMKGTGWNCTLARLTCTRANALDGGWNYPAITLTVNIAASAPANVTNIATVSGGGETYTANDTALDPTSVGLPADLTVAATHAGTFTQGQTGAAYTITVGNSGRGPTSGAVTLTDTLPAKLTATAMSGTGWNCTLATLTCTRTDALAPGASFPPVALTVNVAADAPASVTNTATVSGGEETNTANDTASDPTTVGTPADLTVAATHSGNFTQGQTGAVYTIVVSNRGGTATSGSVTLTDTLPPKLTATAMSGAGWNCTLATLTCTRTDALAPGASFPPVALTVNVAADAPASVTNSATVSTSTALDPTTISQPADLTVAATHLGNFTQGQTGAVYTIVVSNRGGTATSGSVTLTDTLPAKLTATAMSGTGWSCTLAALTCARTDALAPGASFPPVALTVNVAADAPASVTNTATVSTSTALDPTTISQPADLTVAATHLGNFTQGQTGAVYTIVVSNRGGTATSGSVTLTDTLPAKLTATAMSGTGWSCTLAALTCARTDALAAGASFPPVALTVNVAADAPASVTNSATVSGGDTASDPTSITQHPDLTVAVMHSGNFAQGQTGAVYAITVSNAGPGSSSGTVTVIDALPAKLTATAMNGTGWTCTLSTLTCTRTDTLAAGANYPAIALSVDVAVDAPATAVNTATVSGGGETTANDTASDLTAIAPVVVCSYSLGSEYGTFPAAGGSGTVTVTAPAGCSWTASSAPEWVTLTAPSSGFGNGTAGLTVAPNTGSARSGTIDVAGLSFTIQQVAASAASARFVPVVPCRIADTRAAAGPFGGPVMAARSTRSFAIPESACAIPVTALAYSLNVTVVPQGPLAYLTLWPADQDRPLVSTLNSFQGTVVANAAIVPAGTDGAVSVYVTGTTDVILDIDGYFDAASDSNSYSFYPAQPCRIADTRMEAGPLGAPSLPAGQSRDFPVPSSSCGMPSTATAYSLNVTVVPDPAVRYLGYLTTWPAGQPRPNSSTLNSWTGKVVANAAIVPAGDGGAISVFVPNPTDVILDANGYFAPPGSPGALSFYPVTPCRVADTRSAGPTMDAGTSRAFSIPASGCFVPSTAAAYSVNVTVVPQAALAFLTVWPAGSERPLVSTLNSLDAGVVANAAIVPAGTDGAVSVFVTGRTDVVLDINGYFAP